MESKFTDTDLQRLKNHIEEHNEKMEHGGYVDDRGCPFPHHWSDISALLRRLECAEVLLERLTNPNEPYKLSDVDKDNQFYKDWLKSKGESQ